MLSSIQWQSQEERTNVFLSLRFISTSIGDLNLLTSRRYHRYGGNPAVSQKKRLQLPT